MRFANQPEEGAVVAVDCTSEELELLDDEPVIEAENKTVINLLYRVKHEKRIML